MKGWLRENASMASKTGTEMQDADGRDIGIGTTSFFQPLVAHSCDENKSARPELEPEVSESISVPEPLTQTNGESQINTHQ